MKILTITSNDLGISWGPAIHYLELWNEVAEHSNFEISGIAPSWTLKESIIKTNFNLKYFTIPDLKGFRQLVYDFKVFQYLLSNHRQYDLVYIRLSHWHIFQILFLYLTKKKFILELNGLSKEDSKSSRKSYLTSHIIELQEKWLVKHAKLNICVSEGIENAIKKRHQKTIKSITIANGVATPFFKKANTKTFDSKALKVGYVGTFTAWDGASEIIKLARSFPNITFVLVGDGGLRSKIKESAPHNVILPGKLDYKDLPNFYSSIDAAIVLYEFKRHKNVKASSLKTLEYVASNLPIFATKINGQEFIEDNGFGLLINEEDHLVESFDKFLKRLGSYKDAYNSLDYNLIDRFGWKRTALKTITAIKKLDL